MPRFFTCLLALAALAAVARGQETAIVPLADGFGLPVGLDGTKQYFKARGFRAHGHLGEDWNGKGGGDTDLGDPVYATAHGVVVYSDDFRAGWGNVIIIRHGYWEGGKVMLCDSLYGHLQQRLVGLGAQVRRGKKIGTIGNNRGMYDAHLHFEIRRNIYVGMFRSHWPRDFSTYFDPTHFITTHRTLATGRTVQVPLNTFRPGAAAPLPSAAPPPLEYRVPGSPSTRLDPTTPSTRQPFRVDRFEDLKKN